MNYTHPIIRGEKYTTVLPAGTALVLEGGGTRGFYSAGVLEAFAQAGIMFPYIIGVSAGAANALSYISGQSGRNRQIIEHYVGNHQYVSKRNLLKHGTMFGYDYIFGTVPQKHIFWDMECFESTNTRLLTGVTDCATGKPIWFEKDTLTGKFEVTRASCSVPIIGKIVRLNGLDLLDGGISAPIPIEQSIADGNAFHVIVLTRNQGYTKPPFKHKWLLKLMYRKYPNFIEAMMNRHEIYNRQLALCEQLEREGKAIIIRPQKPLVVDTTASDTAKLLALHDDGCEDGVSKLGKILRPFNN